MDVVWECDEWKTCAAMLVSLESLIESLRESSRES